METIGVFSTTRCLVYCCIILNRFCLETGYHIDSLCRNIYFFKEFLMSFTFLECSALEPTLKG